MVRNPQRESLPEYEGIAFADKVDEILNDPQITLVTICTRPDSHFHYAKLCLEHGKNVLVEKPFTTTLDEAKTLLRWRKKKAYWCRPSRTAVLTAAF